MPNDCQHLQQTVAPLFKGLVGQKCCKCKQLIGAWRERTGELVSPGELMTLRVLQGEDQSEGESED